MHSAMLIMVIELRNLIFQLCLVLSIFHFHNEPRYYAKWAAQVGRGSFICFFNVINVWF